MGLWRFALYLRRISTFFHPPQFRTYAYPLGTFSTPTPSETPTFHLEHSPQVGIFLAQVETAVVGWIFKLTVLFCEFKFFTPKPHFVDPFFSIPAF